MCIPNCGLPTVRRPDCKNLSKKRLKGRVQESQMFFSFKGETLETILNLARVCVTGRSR